MENKWPLHQHHLWTRWNQDARDQGVGRSKSYIYRHDREALFRDLTQSQPIGLTRSDYVACPMRGDDAKLVARQHRLLEERQHAAAQLGMHMYGFRVILKNTFATDDLDTVINQLVFRSQGQLQQFVDDRDLFIRVVGEIIDEFQLRQPTPAPSPRDSRTRRPQNNDADTKWIRIFWGQTPMGPPDRDQWRDHGI